MDDLLRALEVIEDQHAERALERDARGVEPMANGTVTDAVSVASTDRKDSDGESFSFLFGSPDPNAEHHGDGVGSSTASVSSGTASDLGEAYAQATYTDYLSPLVEFGMTPPPPPSPTKEIGDPIDPYREMAGATSHVREVSLSPRTSRADSWILQTFHRRSAQEGLNPSRTQTDLDSNSDWDWDSPFTIDPDPFRYEDSNLNDTPYSNSSHSNSRWTYTSNASSSYVNIAEAETDPKIYNAYTAEQLTFFDDFLHSPFASTTSSSPTGSPDVGPIGTNIGPLDETAHVPCECDRCFLMEVALTRDPSKLHPIEPWLAAADLNAFDEEPS